VQFRRDRLTWLAYALLAWFAYLQAAPGLVVPHLRDELDIGYTTGGLHVAAFAGGSILAGFTATGLERALGPGTARAVMEAAALEMDAIHDVARQLIDAWLDVCAARAHAR